MARKLGKMRSLATSLVLAGGAIFGTAASADYQGTPSCFQQVEDECATEWQAWGYRNYEDCYQHEPCYYCMDYYHCGWLDYYAPGKPRPY